MKKFLIIFFLLMLCLLVGFTIWFSYSFNADSYRERIVKNLSQMTGRTVEIKGPVSLKWSPFPTLVISNLTLANQADSKIPEMFTAEQIRAEIEWSSLLKEPLVIKKVVFEKPSLLLERMCRYETNFDFPILFKTTQNMDSSFLNGQNNFSLSIKEVEIKNGTFTYNNVIAREKTVFNGITGTGSVSSLEGPFSFSGTFLMDDKPKKVELNIGKIELSQGLPISLNLTDIASKTTIKTSGSIIQDTEKAEEWLTLSGVIGSDNAGLFFQNMGVKHWPTEPLVGSFTLKVKIDKTVFDSLTVRQGEGENETSFFLGEQSDEESEKKIPTFVVKNINLEKWKDFLMNISRTNIFGKLETDFRLQIEEAKINNQSLKQAAAKGRIENGLISFANLTAQLPFGSSLGLTGTWVPKEEKLDAEVQFQSADLHSFLEWILGQIQTEFLPENGIKNAQLVGQIHFDPNQIDSNIKAGVLDETEFSGKFNLLLKEKPEVMADLEIKKLNLDQYVNLTVQDLKKDILPNADFDFNIQAQKLTFHNYIFEQVGLTGTKKEKHLSLTEFSGKGTDNSVFSFTADLENFGTENLLIQNLKGDFEIPNLSNFTPLAKTPLNKTTDVKGNATYTGSLENGNLQSEMIFNQATLKVNGDVENLLNHIKFSETFFSLEHADIQNFLTPFKKTKELLPHLSGKLRASFTGNGTLDSFFAKDFLVTIGRNSLKGEANWDLNQKAIQATLTSSELDLNQFFPSFDTIKKTSFEFEVSPEWQLDLDLSSDKIIYDNEKYALLKTKLALKDQTLTVPSFSLMSLDEKGSCSLNGKAILKNPMIIDGQFNADKMPVKNLYKGENFSLEEGYLTLSGNFIASGISWVGFLQSLRSEGKLSWQDGTMRGIDMNELTLAAEKSLKQYQAANVTAPLIKHALSNGATKTISGVGSFQAEQGELKLPEFKVLTNFGDVFIRRVKWPLLNRKVNALLGIVLKTTKRLPSLDIQLKNGQLIPQYEVFEKALEQEARALEKQNLADKEKQEQLQAEERRNEILVMAQEILSFSEEQIKQMKDTAALRSSAEGQELMSRAFETLEEVLSLAVRPDLNGEQLTLLQEKANLLNIQSQELKNYLVRQEVLRQREAVQKLPPLVKKRITELIQIYNQNSQSAVMAGLVQGSQQEEEKITQNLELLTKVEDLNTAKTLIDEIKASFQKIQKALDYARQLDLAGGNLPQGE